MVCAFGVACKTLNMGVPGKIWRLPGRTAPKSCGCVQVARGSGAMVPGGYGGGGYGAGYGGYGSGYGGGYGTGSMYGGYGSMYSGMGMGGMGRYGSSMYGMGGASPRTRPRGCARPPRGAAG